MLATACARVRPRGTRGVGHIARRSCGRLLLLALLVAWPIAVLLRPVFELALPVAQKRAPKQVVVVGGGFAGLAVARRLRRDFDVTLVDPKQFFEFVPGMVRPYVQPGAHNKLALDYEEICTKMHVHWLWGYAVKLEDQRLTVRLSAASESSEGLSDANDHVVLPFDYCVVAVGCQYGVDLGPSNSDNLASNDLWYPSLSPLPGNDDQRRLRGRRNRIDAEHSKLAELAARGAHVAIIGAGFVGVEYATELRHFFPNLNVSIVDKAPGCCTFLCASARRYIQQRLDDSGVVSYYDADYSPADDRAFWSRLGRPVPERVFMSVGLRPQCEFLPSDCVSTRGWVRVTETLQVAGNGSSDDDAVLLSGGSVFAIGNCAETVPGLDPLPKNSFPAEEMAAHVVRNIRRIERSRDVKPFYWPWASGVSATSLGPRDGVLVVNNRLQGSGFVALRGRVVVWVKEFIRWSKVDECRLGAFGTLIWHFVH